MSTLTARSQANVQLLDRLASSRLLDLDALLKNKPESPKIKMLAKYRREYGFEHLPQPPPAVAKQEENCAVANGAKHHDGMFSFDSGIIKLNTRKPAQRLLYSPPPSSANLTAESKIGDMDEIDPYMEFFKRLVLPESPNPKPIVATAEEIRTPVRRTSKNNRLKVKVDSAKDGLNEMEQKDTEEVADILLGLMSPGGSSGKTSKRSRSTKNSKTTPKRRRARRVESDSRGLSALISPANRGKATMSTYMRSKKKRSPPRPQSADGSGRKRKRSSTTANNPPRRFTFDGK
mmetsp:Transcript_15839/g.19049  ORF Transcript_15839/g.19049 Transcript_15839/m.19049 type:complete len:290 (-) Transcript_15839:80-949(-)